MNNLIPFNKPFIAGNELSYLKNALDNSKLSGDGPFTKKCHAFLESRYNFKKCLLTTSCTDALEMAAILVDIKEGDEVIIPSYTFVSTVNAFVLRGAKVVFADSNSAEPNIDVALIEKLITPKTKAIVPVHYAGVACDMDAIMQLADKYNLLVVEDAAQAIDSFYKGKPLGSIGHLAAFSFHETKNIIAGEGGMLVVNDDRFIERAEIIREKGTNRSKFFRGEVDKYNWIDIGSSFLPSDMIAAFLYAQLEHITPIQEKRKQIWSYYHEKLTPLEKRGLLKLAQIPDYATNNAHMFYIVVNNGEHRDALIKHLKTNNILAVFHYLSLHKSPFFERHATGLELPNSDKYSDCLIRLPFFYELTELQQERVVNTISEFYNQL